MFAILFNRWQKGLLFCTGLLHFIHCIFSCKFLQKIIPFNNSKYLASKSENIYSGHGLESGKWSETEGLFAAFNHRFSIIDYVAANKVCFN